MTQQSVVVGHRARPPGAWSVSFIGKDGEWAKPRVLEVQFQGLLGTDIEHLKDTRTEVILEPEEFRTGEVVEPYSSIKNSKAPTR